MYHLLVIEDDTFNQILLRTALTRNGYEVTIAKDGKEGIAQAEALQPALILCDWMMPQMNGLEVCRWIKAHPDLSSTFFILLTARTELADRIQGLDTGADDFISKPIDAGELLARVRAGLRLYQVNRDLRQTTRDLQVQQQRLQAELAQAANYVRSLLPKTLTGDVVIQSRFIPSQQLGGDCFDYYWIDDEHLVVYLLDVSGHGVGAALPSVSIQSLLRSQALQNTELRNPAQVMATLNRLFQMNENNPRFFTLWYGVYHRSTRQLIYTSAGHPPAILIRPEVSGHPHLITLGQQGLFPIGMLPEAEYDLNSIQLQPTDTLYIFSDGIYEVKEPDGMALTHEQFCSIIHGLSQIQPPDLDTILQKMQTRQRSPLFEDDCSILQIQIV